MTWSPQQEDALKAVSEWLADPNGAQVFRLFGYAGTGKTTLALEIASIARNGDDDDGKVLFAAFTGKASLVMRSKGCRGASTIHSLIYKLDDDTAGQPQFTLNEDSKLQGGKLLIIDECSMVGAELATDLLSFKVRVLVLGDPAQLPPVQDAGYFTACEPDVMLTEVHRQARDNPIIRLSIDIREGRGLPLGDHGACKVIARGDLDQHDVLTADQILVGMNRTRTLYNTRIRALKQFTSETPVKGEKLVCLRNDRKLFLFNGGLWGVERVRKANEVAVHMTLAPEDAGDTHRKAKVKVHSYFFQGREGELQWEELKKYQQFTFGYALTVHKSQGSQWNNVMLFDESGAFREDRARWLYTGVTRAAEKLMVVM